MDLAEQKTKNRKFVATARQQVLDAHLSSGDQKDPKFKDPVAPVKSKKPDITGDIEMVVGGD